LSKEEKVEVPSKELEDERPEDEPLMSDPEEDVVTFTGANDDVKTISDPLEVVSEVESTIEHKTEDKPVVEPAKKEDEEPESSVDEAEPWPPFKVMPGSKKDEEPTVRERVPQFRDKVLKLYKRMKRGSRLTEKQFAKKLKLKDPKDIQAAGIAWHFLRDEKKIAGEQFYKPLVKE